LTSGEFLHFLGQARGSLLELDTQAAIALDLSYLKAGQYEKLEHERLPSPRSVEPAHRIPSEEAFETLKR